MSQNPAPPRSEQFGGVEIKRSAKLNAATARLLAQQIVTGDAPVGTSLPAERELADSFGIGRGTMREALRLLETFGLIEMRTGRYGGPVVRRPDAYDLSVSLTLAFFANGSSMLDVMEARSVIEPALAEFAAERIGPEALATLRETVAEMRRTGMTQAEFMEVSERFHNTVAAAAESPVLSHLVAGLQAIAGEEALGISYSRTARLSTAAAHEAIIDALERRDGSEARELWQRHVGEAAKYWRRKFPENASRRIEWSIGLDHHR